MDKTGVQNFSFSLKAPRFQFAGWEFAVQIFTFENVYELHPEHCASAEQVGSLTIRCTRLTWAGGQETATGDVTVRATAAEGTMTVMIDAECHETIRCVKLIVLGMPDGAIANLRETGSAEIPADGLLLRYPDGWRGLYTPLAVLNAGAAGHLYARSLDMRVREKRFAFVRRGDGLDLELIFEGLATEMGRAVSVPAWEVGTCASVEQVLRDQARHVRRAYGLVPWEERPDVPAWAREIALVASIHCQHWTGYIFNDYARVLETLRWLAGRIEPRRILAYLPGWEGRYYWQYGDYRPDPRMGGADGFAALMRGARELGVHVMPMFGINYANKGLAGYERWGAPAEMMTAGGKDPSGCEDWDTARLHDHGWQGMLNPGAPTWRHRFVAQIRGLIEAYGFDGVCLDIAAGWVNDPRHPVYEGIVELVRGIRDGHPGVLVAGEGWYDAMGVPTPLVQSGHTRGVLHWHDIPNPALFDTFGRSFAHLCLGDPGRGSPGTHEEGARRQGPVTVARARGGRPRPRR